MSIWFLLIVLTISTNIDNISVGISYGIRQIKIPPKSNLLIALICFSLSMIGIYSGMWLSRILPSMFPSILGGTFLFFIGTHLIWTGLFPKKEKDQKKPKSSNSSLNKVVKKPTEADFDSSKTINSFEAFFLGIALSMNALTNGIGAGLFAFSPIIVSSFAALGSFFSIWLGVTLGEKLAHVKVGKIPVANLSSLIGGLLLLLIATSMILRSFL